MVRHETATGGKGDAIGPLSNRDRLHLLERIGIDDAYRVAAYISGVNETFRTGRDAKGAHANRHCPMQIQRLSVENRYLIPVPISRDKPAGVICHDKPGRGTACLQLPDKTEGFPVDHPDPRVEPVRNEDPVPRMIHRNPNRPPIKREGAPDLRGIRRNAGDRLGLRADNEDGAKAGRHSNARRVSRHRYPPYLFAQLRIDHRQIGAGLVGHKGKIRKSRPCKRKGQQGYGLSWIRQTGRPAHSDLPRKRQ